MNIFNMAELQLKKRGKIPTIDIIIDRARIIRKWLDKKSPIAIDKIMLGGETNNYSLPAYNNSLQYYLTNFK